MLTENLVRPVSRLVNRRRSPERPVQGGYFARNLDALRRCLSYRNADNHSRGLRECAVRIVSRRARSDGAARRLQEMP